MIRMSLEQMTTHAFFDELKKIAGVLSTAKKLGRKAQLDLIKRKVIRSTRTKLVFPEDPFVIKLNRKHVGSFFSTPNKPKHIKMFLSNAFKNTSLSPEKRYLMFIMAHPYNDGTGRAGRYFFKSLTGKSIRTSTKYKGHIADAVIRRQEPIFDHLLERKANVGMFEIKKALKKYKVKDLRELGKKYPVTYKNLQGYVSNKEWESVLYNIKTLPDKSLVGIL